MDKIWQDIFYIDDSKPKCLPDKYYALAIRQIRIITIAFGNEDILITYCDTNDNYHTLDLKKLPFHKLLIE